MCVLRFQIKMFHRKYIREFQRRVHFHVDSHAADLLQRFSTESSFLNFKKGYTYKCVLRFQIETFHRKNIREFQRGVHFRVDSHAAD